MSVDALEPWLIQLKSVIENLEMIDTSLFPKSFTDELWNPVRAGVSNLDDLIGFRQAVQLVQDVQIIGEKAQFRLWYFWEKVGRLLRDYARAQNFIVFRLANDGVLSKLHPLESEEETQDYHWPNQTEENFIEHQEEGFAQTISMRWSNGQEPPIVIRLQTQKPVPRIKSDNLRALMPFGSILYKIAESFLPVPERKPHLEIVGKAEPPQTKGVILGNDQNFIRALHLTEQAATSEASVYISGESGTGKELFARHLHQLSDRSAQPFIPINCSAIPHELIESEMFGHEKGAFTGAYYRKIGKVEQAHRGTLFLDEIGEMPLAFQAKLLRYLQEKKFSRVGGNQDIFSDARIVVATHRDLKQMVAAGSFREDLYYRVNVIPIHIPPLRDRGEDIRFLSKQFFQKYISKSRASRRQVDESIFEVLARYHFPGNVRELDNIIHRTVVMTKKPIISVEDLPEELFQNQQDHPLDGFKLHPFERFDSFIPQDRDVLKKLKREVELVSMSYQRDLDRRFLLHLLEQSGGSARKASELANINRTLFYKLLKRAGIDIALIKKGDS